MKNFAINANDAYRPFAELAAPLVAISYACMAQNLPFYSIVPIIIVSIFAVVQAVLKYFLLDAVSDLFKASGREPQYWATVALVYLFTGLGTVQLFILATKPG